MAVGDVVKPFVVDPFKAVLTRSVPLPVTQEQKDLVQRILDKSCSDSRFAEKAYLAITYVLTNPAAVVVPPVLNSLQPSQVAMNATPFTLNVIGTGFTAGSKVVINGFEAETKYVSATNLQVEGIDVTQLPAPLDAPVLVQHESGVQSNALIFKVTAVLSDPIQDESKDESSDEVKKESKDFKEVNLEKKDELKVKESKHK